MEAERGSLKPWLFLALAGGIGASLWWRQRRRIDFSFRDRVVVITGGSRGLGLVMARQLAAEGAHLALLARAPSELGRAEEEFRRRGATVLALACDVRHPGQVQSAFERILERFGHIDVLINNAGVIQVGPLEHLTLQDFEDALAVHLYGPLHTTFAALPHLRQRGGGRIVNISSIGGRVAVPHLLPYVASKFALAGFSEALTAELRRHNILVTTVYPALMRTGSPPNAQFKGKHGKEYAWFSTLDSLPLLSMSAERAAARILQACRRGSPRLALGYQAKSAILLNDLFPGATARLLALMNRLLPNPAPEAGPESHPGWESQEEAHVSLLTRLSDRATVQNNQRAGG